MAVWKKKGKEIRMINLLKHICKEKEIPEIWRNRILIPIYKKEDEEESRNYRDILLPCIAYKIYTEPRKELNRDVR